MIRKITILLTILTALTAFAGDRTRAVGSGMGESALMPIAMPGATVSGTVSSVQGTTVALASGLVTIDASSAKIVDDDGTPATLAAITPGSMIFALLSANVTTNTALPASLIAVRHAAAVELTGPVSSVDANSITVLGRTITVDANTSFGGRARTLSDILPDDLVAVAANVSGGSLLATSILTLAPSPKPPLLIHGTVTSIGTESWIITDRAGKQWTIVVDAQTKIIGDPKAGDSVEILVNTDSANRYVAVSIMKSPVTATSIVVFSGEVKSIAASSWVIHDSRKDRDITVGLDGDTKIVGNPNVDDGVLVTASVDAAGNYTAIAILKLGIVPPNVTLHGKVKSITGLACPSCDSIWIVGPPVGMGPDYRVIADAHTKISGDPKVGDMVDVVGTPASDGFRALTITKSN